MFIMFCGVGGGTKSAVFSVTLFMRSRPQCDIFAVHKIFAWIVLFPVKLYKLIFFSSSFFLFIEASQLQYK